MTFRKRLLAAQAKGDMTTADLHRWFERPYPTIRYWLMGAAADFEPGGPRGRLARERLYMLEWAVGRKIGFPIPQHLSVDARPQHVEDTLRVVNVKFFELNSAGERVQSSGNLSRGQA